MPWARGRPTRRAGKSLSTEGEVICGGGEGEWLKHLEGGLPAAREGVKAQVGNGDKGVNGACELRRINEGGQVLKG